MLILNQIDCWTQYTDSEASMRCLNHYYHYYLGYNNNYVEAVKRIDLYKRKKEFLQTHKYNYTLHSCPSEKVLHNRSLESLYSEHIICLPALEELGLADIL